MSELGEVIYLPVHNTEGELTPELKSFYKARLANLAESLVFLDGEIRGLWQQVEREERERENIQRILGLLPEERGVEDD